MIHARAPHFLWPYVVRYAAHQLNLQPRVSWPEASPTSLWTGSPGVGSAFRVWGCLALVRDTSTNKLLARAVLCVFLGSPVASADWSFYHPPLHQFLDSYDARFDESVSYYTRYPCRGLPVPPPPLFLAPSLPPAPAPPVPPPRPLVLPRQALLRQVTVDPVGVGARGVAIGGTRSGGARSRGARAGNASSGVAGAGGAGTGGASAGGARVGGPGTGGARTGGAGAGDLDPVGTPSGDTGSGGASSEATRSGFTTSAESTPPPHHHDTRYQAVCRRAREEQERLERERQELRQLFLLEQQQRQQQQQQQQQQQPPPPPQPHQLSLERQLFPPVSGLWALGLPSSPPVRPPSPLAFGPTFSPPDTHPAVWSSPPPHSPPPVVCHYRSRPCPPSALLLSPPPSSLPVSPTPISDYYRVVCPIVSRALATGVTDPCFSPSSVSALTAAVTDFAAASRIDYSTRVVPAPPTRPLSVGGEFSLGCDVLEDRHSELKYLAAASPSLCTMLFSPEEDLDSLHIPTPCTYREAVSRPWASQWKAAMDSKLASWRSTRKYVDAFPPPRANVVDGMWLFKVKQPPGSPPVFKVCYVARGFSQHEGVDFFQTFAPTPKMTTLWVLLHVVAQRDYKLHSFDFSTAFLQGRLHEEIWLRRPPGFTGTFPTGT
ncbi:unnamed protein product [Closterium sp. NIES-53]